MLTKGQIAQALSKLSRNRSQVHHHSDRECHLNLDLHHQPEQNQLQVGDSLIPPVTQLRASASSALNSLSEMNRRQGSHLKDCALLPKRRSETSKECVDYCLCPRLKLNESTPPYYLADGLLDHKKEKVGIRSNKESLHSLHIPVVVRVIWGSHSHSHIYLFNN